MQQSNLPFIKFYFRALVWLAAVALIGAAPVLFLQFIGWLSQEDLTGRELEAISEVRYSVFVCCAIVGSVFMTWIQGGVKLKSNFAKFAIYWSPMLLLVYLFLKYLLLYVQFSDMHNFGPGNLSTSLVAAYTFVYGLFGRTLYEIKKYYAGRYIDLHHTS
jgi:hypothetical protein